MILEIFLVLLLVGVNGLLAMSELAVVSSRPARLRVRAERGDRGAGTALALAEDPGKFLSTVQIGITLVGVLAGAFSGATIGLRLAEVLPELGVPKAAANEVGVAVVVVVITYLSLIIGELVPKQIALAAPERVASRVAPAMLLLSRVAAPVVWLLDRSGKLVLSLIGQSGRRETSVSDEDIRMLLSEAAGAGVIHRAEKELIGGVMRFSDRRARGLMTPSRDVETASINETRAEILARFQVSGHSRLPLRRDGPDDIVGVIHSRDLLATTETEFDALALMRPAPVIQATLPALDVTDRLRNSPCHLLLVYDEYGHFEGIVTPMDVLGAIAGGFDEA
jgi:putative hemolysin